MWNVEGADLQNKSQNLIVWNPKGIPTRSMEIVAWYSSSQVSTAKHVSYPQLTATGANFMSHV